MKNVAVVGASGAVGQRDDPAAGGAGLPRRLDQVPRLRAQRRQIDRPSAARTFPSSRSRPEAFQGVDIVLSSTPASSRASGARSPPRPAPSSSTTRRAFRMDPDVPLVVPEVNPHDIAKHKGIIANPNCSTIQMVVALKPLHDAARIRRVVVSTYQAVSGAGQTGIDELDAQTARPCRGPRGPGPVQVRPPDRLQLLPQIDDFLPSGYTKEEMKMVHETRKILGDASIDVCPTCVRVPVVNCHSESILVETERPITVEAEARALWSQAPGIDVVDDPANREYPLPARRRRPRRGLRRPHPRRPRAATTPSSSGASATTSARAPPPTPSRSPRSCSSSTPSTPDRNRPFASLCRVGSAHRSSGRPERSVGGAHPTKAGPPADSVGFLIPLMLSSLARCGWGGVFDARSGTLGHAGASKTPPQPHSGSERLGGFVSEPGSPEPHHRGTPHLLPSIHATETFLASRPSDTPPRRLLSCAIIFPGSLAIRLSPASRRPARCDDAPAQSPAEELALLHNLGLLHNPPFLMHNPGRSP